MHTIISPIGVGIPTYQRPDKLAELLATIPHRIPVVVSDNGATLTREFHEAHPSVRFQGMSEVLPIFANWNNAAKLQTADWLFLPSDDDVYLDGAFGIAEKAISQHPSADIIVFGNNFIDGDGRIFGSWVPPYCVEPSPRGFMHFRYGVTARMPSVLFKRTLYNKLGGFQETFKLTAADSDFIQRATLVGNAVFIPEIISGYRVWGGGLTANRVASTEWMDEIDLWCEGVAALDLELGTRIYERHFHDEIFAQNLLTGAQIVRSKSGRGAVLAYLKTQRFPTRAKPSTYMRLLRTVL